MKWLLYALLLTLSTTLVSAALTDGLRTFHDFDINASVISVDRVNVQNGSLNSSSKIASLLGQGVEVNGAADRVEISHNSAFDIDSNKFSKAFWINVSNAEAEFIYRKGHTDPKEVVYISNSGGAGHIEWNIQSSAVSGCDIYNTNGAFNDGLWHYIVLVRNASTLTNCASNAEMQIWIDGILQNNTDNNPALLLGALDFDNSARYCIGTNTAGADVCSTGGGNDLEGLIDEFGYWNRSLTSAEIQSLYNAGVGLAYPFSAPDSTAPNYSGVYANPPSPLVYTGSNSIFSSLWSDDVALSTVLIEHNFTGILTNYSMSASGNNYSYSRPIGVGGYVWRSIANDSSNNWNTSMPYQSYTVTQASSSVQLLINGSASNLTTTAGIINLTGTLITGIGNLSLFVNGSLVNSSSSPVLNSYNFSIDGLYVINLTLANTQNYSATSMSWKILIESAINDTPSNLTSPFTLNECPTQSLENTLLYSFVGVLLLVITWLSITILRMPAVSALNGLGFIMYGYVLYGCGSAVIAFVPIVFGFVLIVYAASKF